MFTQPKISLTKSVINSTYEYIKENRSSLKTGIIGAVGAIAAYIFINYLTSSEISNHELFTEPYDVDLEVINTIENEKIKRTFENFYKLSNDTVLNTDLELQKRPSRLAAILNQCGMKLGFSDRFANIRAENVVNKIKEFISEKKLQFHFMKTVKKEWEPVNILRNFEARTGKRYEEVRNCLQIAGVLKHFSELLDFSEDQSHYFEFIDVMDETVQAGKGNDLTSVNAKNLLFRLSKTQGKKVSIEKEKTSPLILPFQTDPFKNAFMQLSIIYRDNCDLENAKFLLYSVVRNTDIKTDNWQNKLPDNYFKFFGKTCTEHADRPTTDSALSNKFLIAAKEYIWKYDRGYAEALSHALEDADEAKQSRLLAIDYYQQQMGSFISDDFFSKMESNPSYFISLMNLYAKENHIKQLQHLGKNCFPHNQNNDLGLSDNQLKIWDAYQIHLSNMNLPSALDAVKNNIFEG